MKRVFTFILAAAMLIVLLSSTVAASEDLPIKGVRTIEYLENGDYIVTELSVNFSDGASPNSVTATKQGSKTATYYNSVGTRIWDVTVNGTFSYTNGISATATSASAIVNLYSTHASFVSKSAYTSGNTATAIGTVAYNSVSTTMSVSVSCDKYGNIY